MAAGYTDCCEGAYCAGHPANCFCDAECVFLQNCCNDFESICCKSTLDFLIILIMKMHQSSYALHTYIIASVEPTSQPATTEFMHPTTMSTVQETTQYPFTSQGTAQPATIPSTSQETMQPPTTPFTSQGRTEPPTTPFNSQGTTQSPITPFTSQGTTQTPITPFTSQGTTQTPITPFNSQGTTQSPITPFTSQGTTQTPTTGGNYRRNVMKYYEFSGIQSDKYYIILYDY